MYQHQFYIYKPTYKWIQCMYSICIHICVSMQRYMCNYINRIIIYFVFSNLLFSTQKIIDTISVDIVTSSF
jgi:hypothetical protein